jgi:hypothetical protein
LSTLEPMHWYKISKGKEERTNIHVPIRQIQDEPKRQASTNIRNYHRFIWGKAIHPVNGHVRLMWHPACILQGCPFTRYIGRATTRPGKMQRAWRTLGDRLLILVLSLLRWPAITRSSSRCSPSSDAQATKRSSSSSRCSPSSNDWRPLHLVLPMPRLLRRPGGRLPLLLLLPMLPLFRRPSAQPPTLPPPIVPPALFRTWCVLCIVLRCTM